MMALTMSGGAIGGERKAPSRESVCGTRQRSNRGVEMKEGRRRVVRILGVR